MLRLNVAGASSVTPLPTLPLKLQFVMVLPGAVTRMPSPFASMSVPSSVFALPSMRTPVALP